MAFKALGTAIEFLFVIIQLFEYSTCSPIPFDRRNQGPSKFTINQRRQGGFFSVLGIAGLGNNTPHPRLEIRELEKNKDQWNVYLLGLRRFQSAPQSDKLSYYQIAGRFRDSL